jgi:hypothetical protein
LPGGTLQIVRDWILRFNEGGPERLAIRKAPGQASIGLALEKTRAIVAQWPSQDPRVNIRTRCQIR